MELQRLIPFYEFNKKKTLHGCPYRLQEANTSSYCRSSTLTDQEPIYRISAGCFDETV